MTGGAVPTRVFLLSPAHCGGKRAQLLFREGAAFDLALRVRSRSGAPIGEVFAFLSGLYFRGKLAYAERFGSAPGAAWVITPSDGLVEIGERVKLEDLLRYSTIPVDAENPRYRTPLLRDCERLSSRLGATGEVVFLGSLATPKYLSILVPTFAERLLVPSEFVGRGDMSRGALMLAAVRAERELDYLAAARDLPAPPRRRLPEARAR